MGVGDIFLPKAGKECFKLKKEYSKIKKQNIEHTHQNIENCQTCTNMIKLL